ncbi:tyrosine-type recombinase/integrase [Pseudomonadales bacterium]|nr:tyrosine-type recombinase/integrase [Pseudomonadales bacterium]
MKKLTHKFVANVSKTGRFFDGGGGLNLLVRNGASGPRKYWVFRFTDKGKRQEKSLGIFPSVSLTDARKGAISLRAGLNNGMPPTIVSSPDIPSHEESVTFRSFALEWIELNKIQWTNQKHYLQWLSSLEAYCFPFIGEKPIDEVSVDDLLRILRPIWNTKTESATRIRERIERILAAAIVRGLKPGPNPAAWRGHLEFLLPKPSKIRQVRHHKSIPYQELPGLYGDISKSSAVSAYTLRFLILTAGRTGEVVGARWNEFSDDTWVLAASRMKARREHRVPLSTEASKMLMVQNEAASGDYVFHRNGRCLSNMAMLQFLKRISPNATVHGFRSSFRVWAAEVSGFSSDLAEQALAHSVGSQLERAYQRSDLLEQRRGLMEAWGQYITGGQVL